MFIVQMVHYTSSFRVGTRIKNEAVATTYRVESSNVSFDSVLICPGSQSRGFCKQITLQRCIEIQLKPPRHYPHGLDQQLGLPGRRQVRRPAVLLRVRDQLPARVEHGLERAQAPVVVLLRGQELAREQEQGHDLARLGCHRASQSGGFLSR
jgi:hypothetical protein